MKVLLAALVAALLVAGCGSGSSVSTSGGASSRVPTAAGTPSAETTPGARARTSAAASRAFDRHRYSLTDPTSIWVVVNKRHPISPLDFRPQISLVRGYQVARSAAPDLTRLLDDADAAGVPLKIASAFRSLAYQQGVHGHLVATLGEAAADSLSARPGYSEHQTGLAVDLQPLDGTCALDSCFARTPAYRWLAAHAWRYGFVIRYTAANRRLTGYAPEPWHFRYVGPALARELRRAHAGSLEEFFGVSGGGYPA